MKSKQNASPKQTSVTSHQSARYHIHNTSVFNFVAIRNTNTSHICRPRQMFDFSKYTDFNKYKYLVLFLSNVDLPSSVAAYSRQSLEKLKKKQTLIL